MFSLVIMDELSNLVEELATRLKVDDIPHLKGVVEAEGLDFDVVVASVKANEQSMRHLTKVYETLHRASYEPDVLRETISLQLHYEVVHTLRKQLHKKFADAFLGEKEEIRLKEEGCISFPTEFTRQHFLTWTHPISIHQGDMIDHLGYRYRGSPVDHITKYLPQEVLAEQESLLANIELLSSLETAYVNTLYDPVNKQERSLRKIKGGFSENVQTYCNVS